MQTYKIIFQFNYFLIVELVNSNEKKKSYFFKSFRMLVF